MFGFKDMPQSASSLFTAYASFATTAMMIRSMTTTLLPPQLISLISSVIFYFFPPKSTLITTIVIDQKCDFLNNQLFEAAQLYLRTKINPSMDRLKASKTPRQNKVALSMEKGQKIVDHFEDIRLQWGFVATQKEKRNEYSEEKCHYELVFPKKFLDRVVNFYFPYILQRAKEIKALDNVAKLCSSSCSYDDESLGGKRQGKWGSVRLEHPATFDTLALDPDLKKMIIDDLDRFVKRKEFYRKVGKAWKRGYLLYGPPGTGKSSLIAAMANYLKFDIYDLDLSDVYSNQSLRSSLLSTTNRSILVIEDIDCSVDLQNRKFEEKFEPPKSRVGFLSSSFPLSIAELKLKIYVMILQLTLSGMLNFIDGLWSSCGDERIIIFTTNHKEKLDPALLRPGRMDVHIHLGYCTSKMLKVLATNYLGAEVTDHRLYEEVQGLIDCVNATPAEIAEELMKSDDIDVVIEGLANFLKLKSKERKAGDEKIDRILEENKASRS
ncbi:AAA-ATPase [Cucumis melo var. makuwa]|uniref:AAA-ATPase n=1 Tax=Cucumis melo var. makuwa TaxID=1194695 RepID=A0A5D3CL94_CUCMM|nr:AAA-ATPase [Cucumis melo var. makuwa]TYK12591.1 AAA-ATPase [Cucumis melo var. makuwa]